MASDMLCYPGGTDRFNHERTGPGPGTAASAEKFVRGRMNSPRLEERYVTDSPVRTYVLDTSVLLSDPWAATRFAEHEVVVPLVVISELEAKRHHHELGWFARQALRMFDDLRLEHGRLDQPIPVGTQGGTLHVELNHSDPSVLPAGFRTETNDARILTCAANLAAEGKRVTLVSKDFPLRVKAGAVGLAADEYHAQDVITSGWTGMDELELSADDIDTLYADGEIDLEAARNLPCHTGIRLLGVDAAQGVGAAAQQSNPGVARKITGSLQVDLAVGVQRVDLVGRKLELVHPCPA